MRNKFTFCLVLFSLLFAIRVSACYFSIDNDSKCLVGNNFVFTNTTGNSGQTWKWDFGDGSAYVYTYHANHTYANAGTYTVVLHEWVGNNHYTVSHSLVVKSHPSGVTATSNTPICAGSNLIFNGSTSTSSATYAWTGPNSFTSSLQDPTINAATTAATGTYTFKVTKNGCFTSVTTNVTVNAKPTATASNNGPVCLGGTINLTGGSSLSGSTYSWTGPNSFTSTSQNPTISNATATNGGNYILTVSKNGCASASVSTTVSITTSGPAGVSAANNGPICAGQTLNLTGATSSTGATFSWTGPNSFTSSSQNPSIANATTAAAGTYTLTVTKNGCSVTATTTPVVNALPASVTANASSVCSGATLTLTGSSSTSGVTYAWSGPNSFTSTQQNPTIANATSTNNGTYTLTVTKNGCSAQAQATATIKPLPTGVSAANGGNVCAGNTLTFTGSSTSSGVTYAWSGPNSFSSSNQNPTIANATTAATGTYTLTVTGSNSCTASATTTATVYSNLTDGGQIGTDESVCGGFDPALITNTTSPTGASGTIQYMWQMTTDAATAANTATNYSTIPSASSATYDPSAITVTTWYRRLARISGCSAYPAVSNWVKKEVKAVPTNVTAGNSGPVCAGATLNLTSSSSTSGVTYSWSGPNSFSSAIQNPSISNATTAASGTYTVTVSKSGCSATATTTPVVNAVPAGVTAGNNGPVCAGNTLNFTGNSTTSGVTYSWTGPNSFTSSLQNPSIANATIAAAGTYTLTVTGGNTCTATATTTPNVYPNLTNGGSVGSDQSLCNGYDPALITNTSSPSGASGTIDYAWQMTTDAATAANTATNYSVIASANNNTYDPTAITVTTWYRRIARIQGCSAYPAVSNWVKKEVKPVPANATASSNSAVCEGSALNLTGSSTTSGVTYSWTGPNSFTSSQQNPTIATTTAAAAGLYTLTVTGTNNCTATATTNVTINPLAANVSASSNSPVCAGSTVMLFGNSTTSGVTYTWSGPNSFASTAQNPTIPNATVAASGTYTLVVRRNGCNASTTTSVTVNPGPTAGFTVNDPSQPLTGNNFIFTNTGTAVNVTYLWKFGDGGTSTLTNPSHSYVAVGTYQVRQIVTNLTGCEDSITVTVNVNPDGTVAQFSANSNVQCLTNNSFVFTNQSTGTAPITYLWNFGDNTATSTQTNPTHVYAAIGTYNVKLVTTGAGGADSVIHQVTVNANPVGVTASSNSPVCRGGTVNFTGNSTTPGVTYAWSGPNSFTSNLQNPSISNVNSATAGTYTLTVTGTNTCATPVTTNVVINALPAGVYAGSNSPVCEGSTVNLTSGSTTSNVTYSWSGPNTFTSNQQNPSISNVTAAAQGTYTVTVTGTNTCSATATTTLVINTKPTGLTANSNSPQCEGSTLNFTSSSTTPGVTYAWTGPNSFTSAMQNPSIANVTMADAGTYTVTMTGTNTCVNSTTTTVVLNPLPTSVTASSSSPLCEGETLYLSAGSTTPGVTYSWTGPNGFTANGQYPTVPNTVAASGGTYTVTANKGGCTTPATTIATIKPFPAGVTASNNGPVCTGSTLTFSGNSTTSGVSYSWTGPNGFASAMQNPSIANATTAASGIYTLTVSGTNGCSAMATTNPTVYPNLNNGGQIGVDESACGTYDPAMINDVAPPSGASGTIEYNWYYTTDVNTAAGMATNYTLIPGAISSTYDPSAISVTTWYRRVARIQGCGAYPAQSNWVKKEVNTVPGNITANSNSPVCEGGMVMLMGNSSNASVTYSWTGPNGFSSTDQNPSISNATTAASGTYTLTVTGAANCVGTATTNVTVNALPDAVAASSNTPICEGATLNLMGSSSTPGVTYSWSGPNSFTSMQQNPSIAMATLAAAGTYTVTVSKNGCSNDATTNVVVNAVPSGVAANTSPVCEGDTLELLGSSATSGATYSWTGPNSFTATGQHPYIYNVTQAEAGTYTLTVSKNGCSSASTTVVIVNSVPNNVTASSNTPVCTGYTLNLFGNSTTPGVTYIWSGPNSFASSDQNPTIPNATMGMAGTYTLTVSSTACGTTATTNVVVNPGPTAGFNVNNSDQSLSVNSFTFTTTGPTLGNTYNWNFGDATTSNATNPSHSYTAVGTYTVTQVVISGNGCVDSSYQYVTVNPDSVDADFTINDTAQCLSNNSFTFTSTVTGTGPFTYNWDFGDATSSTLPNPTHVYTATNPGGYAVTLIVTGASGTKVVSHNVNVGEGANAGFTINNNTQHLTGNNFVFTSTDTSTTNTYAWTFGDAGTSTLKNPTHSYTAVGPYTVTQTVNSPDGCSASYGLPVYVISDSVGGGGDGGLESESLGGLVTRRDFNSIKYSIDKRVNYNLLPVFSMNMSTAKTTGDQELTDMMPAELVPGNVLRTSTPKDLLSLTAAKDVLSVDYTVNQQAKAVVLGIKTLNKAYNHTKSICDRFRGADLLAMDTVNIKGYSFIRYALRQDNGTVEYAVAFIAGKKAGRTTYALQTNWLISEYALDDTLYNFQVWAAQPDHTAKLVGDILDKLADSRPIDQVNQVVLPKAYVVSGIRKKENLVVKINNTADAGPAKLTFVTHMNEQSGATNIEVPMTLTKGMNEVNVAIQDGYEFQGTVYLGSTLTDEVYLADGNWGTDFDEHRTSLTLYKTENHPDRLYMDDEFPMYRSVGLSATTDDYISLYKAVRPGTEKTNLTDYHSLKFFAQGAGSVEIKLTRDSIIDWKAQYKTTVTLDPAGKEYAISFEDFISDKIKKDFNPKDVKTIVFTFSVGSGRKEVVNFNIDNVAFSKKAVQSKKGLQSKAITITPNPTSGVFQAHFSSDEERVLDMTITDLTGKVLYTQTIQAVVGDNVVPVDLKTRASVVLISINGKDVKYDVQKLLIQ